MSGTNGVRGLVLVMGCCVAMTGCSNPAREQIVGKWEASFEMTEEDMAKAMPTDNPIASGIGKLLMKSFRADIQWEFAADDSVTASATLLGNQITRQGSWQFVSGDEKSTTLKIQFENDEPRTVSFAFSDPDTFEAAPLAADGWQLNRVIKFKRVVATP